MRKYVILFVLALLSSPLWAQTEENDSLPWPLNVQNRLDSLVSLPMLQTTQLGLMVYDLTADSVLYRYHERQTLRPASTMKLLTAITAIDLLGGSYRFRTSLAYLGTVDDGVLRGDIYCVGGFDPRFNHDDMLAFVESLQSLGVDTLRGTIVADKTMTGPDRLGEGWCWDDDNPVLSPLLISRKDCFVERFVEELQKAGIVVESDLIEGDTPSDARIICTRYHGLDEILVRMMKDSDNLHAESVFYQIAAATGNRPAKARHACAMIKQMISRLGLNPNNYRIADGSGLSLYNYLSAELEVRLLRYAYRQAQVWEVLFPTLPVAGESGTLSKRMKGTAAAGNVCAKTGTVSGISSLAGYCTSDNGHQLCFAIINQGVLRNSQGRNFQDLVCLALCEP